MTLHQTVKLMPTSKWNVKEPGLGDPYGDPDKPSEGIILDNLTRLVIEEEAANNRDDPINYHTGSSRSDIQKRIEHHAVDHMDLSVYKPLSCHLDALLGAVSKAFDGHHPIVFSPDLVYGYLAKGIALHINKYAEELRDLYVNHAGKKELKYVNNSFVKGSIDNDWSEMFKSFADQLKTETNANSVVQNDLKFSTSTAMTEAHRQVLSMESMKSYFSYKCYTMCGISCVILEGEEKDWQVLHDTVKAQLNEINDFSASKAKKASLKWWSPTVEFMLENFLTTYRKSAAEEDLGDDLKLWWSAMYKFNGAEGSGDFSAVTGWINTFYPYLKEDVCNPWVTHSAAVVRDQKALKKKLATFFDVQISSTWGRATVEDEADIEDFPPYVSSVPFIWDYYGNELAMNILIGYSMVGQVMVKEAAYPYGAIKTFPAWVIHYASEKKSLDDVAVSQTTEGRNTKMRGVSKKGQTSTKKLVPKVKCVIL